MRVLWFSHSPSLAIKKLTDGFNVGTSWIESLDRGLQAFPEVELGIAFMWAKSKGMKSFRVDDHPTQYFPLPRYPDNKWIQLYYNHFGVLQPKKALNDYLKVVEEFKPDVIHFFGTESNYPLIIPKLKVPSIIWFQGNLTTYRNVRHMVFPSWKTIRHEKIKSWLKGTTELHFDRYYKSIVEREQKIFAAAQNFSGRTDWDRRVTSVLAPQADYYHLEEAMRTAFHENEWKAHQNRDKFVLTTTIRSNVHKGLESLLAASKILAPLIDKRLEWQVVGLDEKTAYVKTAKRMAKYGNGDHYVKFLGFRSGDQLMGDLMNSDAYVHPSHIENSPNAVCEAMLMGMPVVSTCVGGVASLIKDGHEGILVQNGESHGLAGAILELYKDPQKAVTLGANARKRGLERNNTEKICANLVQIYEQILAKNAR